MGYYTGSIVEIAHPDLGISLGGGGRYDGMIGRFLGTEVPAFGVSLGFERLVDILDAPEAANHDRVALIMPAGVETSHVIALKKHLVDTGHTVRLVSEQKNMRAAYEQLVADGFARSGKRLSRGRHCRRSGLERLRVIALEHLTVRY